MSIQKIIQEAIEKSPLGVKEAVQEELRSRIALALEAKMNEEEVELDEVTGANSDQAFDLKKKAEAHKSAMLKHRDNPGADSHEKFLKARTSFINAHKKLKALDLPKSELDQLRKGTNISEAEELDELSDYTVEELEDFIMSEDFDQLDEISKGKLAAYVKKAAGAGKEGMSYQARSMTQAAQPDTANKADYKKSQRKVNNRSTGIQRAADRLAK